MESEAFSSTWITEKVKDHKIQTNIKKNQRNKPVSLMHGLANLLLMSLHLNTHSSGTQTFIISKVKPDEANLPRPL